MSRKICIYCGKRKNRKSFSKHKNRVDGLDTRCKQCLKKHSKLRSKLHKAAPPKPELCQCCGKVPFKNKWCLDHDHDDNSFRGWICENCNWGLGQLGDTLESITKAMNYLLAAKINNLRNKRQMDDT